MARKAARLAITAAISMVITGGLAFSITGKCRTVFDPESGWFWCDPNTCTETCYLTVSGPPWKIGCPCE